MFYFEVSIRFWHDTANKVANVLIDSSVIQRYDSDDTLEKCLKVHVFSGGKGAAEFVSDN